ncbi:MAG: O-antigen polymerase [Phycisphaerae bacterium]
MDFIIMILAFAATGVYAWRLFRENPRISTFCYVWAASVIMLASGAVYHEIIGVRASYVNGPGERFWLTWGQYGNAMLAAAVGIFCIAFGHYWANRRSWGAALPEFIDSRAPDATRLGRWALVLLLAGFIPILATGILDPVTLLRSLLHGRNVVGMAGYLYSAGTYFAFFNLFSTLVPFGVGATAILLWGQKRPWMLLGITAFLALLFFLSGTRSAAAAMLAPFVVIPRYMGNPKLFRKMVIVGVVGGFTLFSVQLVYRSIGFQSVRVGHALTKLNPLEVLDGTQLSWTGQAMQDYGTEFHYLDGQSYYAVLAGPVPRVFWPGKPNGSSYVNAVNLHFQPGATMSLSWMGEAYANFGSPGIPIVGLVAGALMGILDVFTRRSGPFAVAVFLALQLRWAFWVRGDSVFSLDTWLFGFILLFAILVVVGPAASDNPACSPANFGEPA